MPGTWIEDLRAMTLPRGSGGVRRRQNLSSALVLALTLLVHAPALAAEGKGATEGPRTATRAGLPVGPLAPLPPLVAEMRAAMVEAARSGDILELLHVFEWNELKPDLADTPVQDALAHWKALSADGEGREILAILWAVLETPHTRLPLGRDLENNAIFVWPRYAETGLKDLTPADEVILLRLVGPVRLQEMRAKGRYLYWRVSIGADGTWHTFRKEE